MILRTILHRKMKVNREDENKFYDASFFGTLFFTLRIFEFYN